MVEDTALSIRSEFASLNARELLNAPTLALLGVSSDGDAELKKVGIRSIFDLATSPLFAIASEIHGAVGGNLTSFALYGRVPGEVVDAGVDGASLADLSAGPLEDLRALDPVGAQAFSNALDVGSVRELALWPPYHTARAILSRAFGGSPGPEADSEAPEDLVPGSRRYPTERVQYDILVLGTPVSVDDSRGPIELIRHGIHRLGRGEDNTVPTGTVALEAAGQLDLATLARNAVGFTEVATGAILTYTQSWYTEGLALGQLLHTLALAPGESTRIAMIDWSRRSRAAAQEGIGESEGLTSDLDRTRSISEIVSAVATEAQEGFSKSSGWSIGGQIGHAGGGAGSFDFSGGGGGSGSGSGGGMPLKLAGGHGESFGAGGGYGSAESTGWTTGQRNLSANMTQNITDRTHQASTLSRTRWATIVREVSQSESERLTTRSVTNFNHMHALSIEYFEVVQLHRVIVELSKATPCLFVPMKVLDFTQPGLVARFRNAIASAGLVPRVRTLAAAEPDRLAIFATRASQWDLGELSNVMGEPVGEPFSPTLVLSLNFHPVLLTSEAGTQPFKSCVFEYQDGTTEEVPFPSVGDIGPQILNLTQVFPTTVADGPGSIRGLDHSKFWDVVAIRLKKDPSQAQYSGEPRISLQLRSMLLPGFPKPVGGSDATLKFTTIVPADATDIAVLEMTRTVNGRELHRHLEQNALYYSQAVWRSLDASTIGQMLASFTFEGHPLLASIDPTPVAVTGNYLVFRRHLPPDDTTAQTTWEAWLDAQDIIIGDSQESIIPLPSGGVFAEAVLGRFNSAEKLDITRFWNWEDSPIPITAPDIAAIEAGSRAIPEDLVPGPLTPPVLQIQIPEEPDPQGLTAILQAIQNGNMFRDMSGLNATIGFAQGALTRAFDAARDAAAQAGENMKTAAEIYKAAFGGQGSAPASQQGTPGRPAQAHGSGKSASETGALINQGRNMDRRGVPMPNGSDSWSSPVYEQANAAASNNGGTTAGDPAAEWELPGFGTTPMSWEGEATSSALTGGSGGGPLASTIRRLIASTVTAVSGDAGAEVPDAGGLSPWQLTARWGDKVPGRTVPYREAYAEWVRDNYKTYDGGVYLCNWFPIHLLVEFAAGNGLPVRLKYWPQNTSLGSDRTLPDTTTRRWLDSHGGQFGSKAAFYRAARSSVTARMLGELNTMGVARDQAREGDFIVYERGSALYWHIEVIVEKGPPLVRESGSVVTGDSGARVGRAPRTARLSEPTFPADALDDMPRRWIFSDFDD